MSRTELRETSAGKLLVSGELNFATVVPLLHQGVALMHAGRPLSIDLSGVTRSNSAGLALLLEWLDQAGQKRVVLRYSNVPASLLAIARISNATDLVLSAD